MSNNIPSNPVLLPDADDGSPRSPSPPADTASPAPFFRRADWIAFAAAFVLSLIGYTATLAPTVTLEDSGELVVASDYLGVPHPPGYPIWTLVTWFFQWVFHFKTFLGHPNPAWGVNFASAFFGAFACGLLAMLVSRSSSDLLRGVLRFSDVLDPAIERLFCAACGVSAGLVLAFSPVMWSQSVIAEVYALNAFFQLFIALLLYRWVARPADRHILYAIGFLFGLGLTNHQTLLFFVFAFAIAILIRDPELFRDFAVVGAALVALLAFNVAAVKFGHPELAWTAPSGPAGFAFWVHLLLAVAIPVAGWLLLPHGREVAITILLMELGLSFYLYLPIASDQNPPMNWGYPRTWEGFLHAISRGQYERITPTDVFSIKFFHQVAAFLSDLRRQFSLPLVVGGVLPFTLWEVTVAGRRVRMFSVAFLLAAVTGVLVTLELVLTLLGQPVPTAVVAIYRAVTLAALAIGGVGALAKAAELVVHVAAQCRARSAYTASVYAVLLGLITVALLFAELQLARMLFSPERMGALARLIILALMLIPVLGAVLLAAQQGWVPNVRFGHEWPPEARGWLLTTAVGFVMVSVVFIMLWNPSLDIQTLFIGRVQFIQSHTLYALWLGYGLVLALAMIELFVGAIPLLRWAAIAAALVAPPGLMLWQNYFDEELVRIVGGAEQNGHDYGWQFGDWQLRGADAIREYLQKTLPPEEFQRVWAEYPDPNWPPPMATNAIFFGGTDPGRFVPTYMIYSAKVRPDVYLITQNALADNTYLNVMRDLYGDTIWIPSILDSNMAFQQYFDQVRSGQVPAGADIAVKDGRISVQGVQGVMQINGILARQIYDNNPHHEFYVEESYVIPWMYEFLEPHGLIMKICRQPSRLEPSLVAKDRAFWDWYCKRLLSDRRFLRDAVARKTFSKLRGAIAGLYAARGLYDEAEYAFRQAIALYPLSPEANFRMADVYLARGRFAEARTIIQEFLKGDPQNDKIREFLGFIDQVESGVKRIAEIEQRAQSGKLEIREAVELVGLYRRHGRMQQFEQLCANLLSQTGLPFQVYLELGRMAYEAQRPILLDLALQRYVAAQPSDPNGWIELAAVQLLLGRSDNAVIALRNAVQIGGEAVRAQVRQDPRFEQLRLRSDVEQLLAPPAAGPPVVLPGTLAPLVR
ncbi:MAG: DUF2723 domain-containing protein [Kiritimatiellae bacterium]|nr:DUF2723 domain-containing protein [Kiritimatiellia bacterium]